jgi:hypothetical protein
LACAMGAVPRDPIVPWDPIVPLDPIVPRDPPLPHSTYFSRYVSRYDFGVGHGGSPNSPMGPAASHLCSGRHRRPRRLPGRGSIIEVDKVKCPALGP